MSSQKVKSPELQEYRMNVDFDNIQKIQYFQTEIDTQEQVEKQHYPEEIEESKAAMMLDEKETQTTLLIHLIKPAPFVVLNKDKEN